MSRRAQNPKELKQLVERLRLYRLNRGLTEQALAKQVGVAYVTLNRWLNSHTLPDELHAYRIKTLLGERKKWR